MRTRFAPSPTGYLHIGACRTALYCYLYARNTKGVNILRIEDTDTARNSQEAVDAILAAMEWLGLEYDEGPFYQSKRRARYKEVVEQLLDNGQAYRCYCSKERLDNLRQELMEAKQKPRYDGKCRDLSPAEQDPAQPHVIRFKNPTDGEVTFNDHIRGQVTVANAELDDLIIVRSDGEPTYNLTVVVDDLDMQVSMVVRGEDHVSNTPRQINIFQALGGSVPEFAHIPMINGDDGKKLSKRHGAVSVLEFREMGYLPEAILNYLVRLGWSHGDQEIFSRAEMIALFDLQHVSKSPATFNMEKLNWLNQHYLKEADPVILANLLQDQYKSLDIDPSVGPDLLKLIPIMVERVHTLREFAEKTTYFFKEFSEFEADAAKKHLRPVVAEPLQALLTALQNITTWDKETLHTVVNETAASLDLKLGKVAQPLRVAVTGNSMSPSIDITLELLGKERVITRIQRALDFIKQREQGNC